MMSTTSFHLEAALLLSLVISWWGFLALRGAGPTRAGDLARMLGPRSHTKQHPKDEREYTTHIPTTKTKRMPTTVLIMSVLANFRSPNLIRFFVP